MTEYNDYNDVIEKTGSALYNTKVFDQSNGG